MKQRNLEYIKISKIEKELESCREIHKDGGAKSKNEFYFDCGANSVINAIQGVIDKDKAERGINN